MYCNVFIGTSGYPLVSVGRHASAAARQARSRLYRYIGVLRLK